MSKGRTGVLSKVFRMNSGSVNDMRRFAGDERKEEMHTRCVRLGHDARKGEVTAVTIRVDRSIPR